MTITTNLEKAKQIIKEEIEEWENLGKPEWPEFEWIYDTETYLLYEALLKADKPTKVSIDFDGKEVEEP